MLFFLIRAVLAMGIMASGYVFAERFVVYAFDPRAVAPSSVGLDMEVAQITSAAGNRVVIWHAPPKAGRPTILYLHGNAGNLAMRHQRFKVMRARGYGVVAPAYPGSSGSTGWPSQELITQTMVEVYADLTKGKITGTPIRPVVYGESLGAAVALQVLTDARVQPPRAVLLEAPFSSLADVGRSLGGLARHLTPLLSSEWQSLEAAPKLTVPLFVMHGTKDPLIPFAQGRAVFQAASSPDKEFYAVQGAGHIDLWTVLSQRHFFGWIDARAAGSGQVVHPNVVLRPKLPSRRRSR